MRHEWYLTAIRNQCAELRSAAIEAGPDAEVPTCPKWTVARLVGHLARVQSWARAAVGATAGHDVRAGDPPQAWDDLLSWWDEQVTGLLAELEEPEKPAWTPFARMPGTTGAWAWRQAHEAAIHRLDAEHARAGDADPNAVPALLFDPDFAADGIEELTTLMVPSIRRADEAADGGTVLLHATDVALSWTVRIEPGATPETTRGGSAGDLTIAGTADAVYRRLWGRPSHASVTGETGLLETLRAP
ncbi:maleylpyruvate isomerase family mycothiol-dependent enzyme [Amycolatopsis pigmentata]|uniref:Maleylpyruvate isomerase family mycothiol-dependent enzyme n=1 Tax=Amycolatopsis pigmentata TaxID=450801 RepID=A0ABW5FVW8_9PSEU